MKTRKTWRGKATSISRIAAATSSRTVLGSISSKTVGASTRIRRVRLTSTRASGSPSEAMASKARAGPAIVHSATTVRAAMLERTARAASRAWRGSAAEVWRAAGAGAWNAAEEAEVLVAAKHAEAEEAVADS